MFYHDGLNNWWNCKFTRQSSWNRINQFHEKKLKFLFMRKWNFILRKLINSISRSFSRVFSDFISTQWCGLESSAFQEFRSSRIHTQNMEIELFFYLILQSSYHWSNLFQGQFGSSLRHCNWIENGICCASRTTKGHVK